MSIHLQPFIIITSNLRRILTKALLNRLTHLYKSLQWYNQSLYLPTHTPPFLPSVNNLNKLPTTLTLSYKTCYLTRCRNKSVRSNNVWDWSRCKLRTMPPDKKSWERKRKNCRKLRNNRNHSKTRRVKNGTRKDSQKLLSLIRECSIWVRSLRIMCHKRFKDKMKVWVWRLKSSFKLKANAESN